MIPEGYKFQFTWWMDFSIADAFGVKAIKDTYKQACNEWKNDVTAMKELTLVLNWKCWHFHKKNDALCKLYSDLYHECYDKCLDNFKGEELTEYWSFLD